MSDPSVAVRQLRRQDTMPDDAPYTDSAALSAAPIEDDEAETMEEVLAGIAEGYKEVLAGDHKPIEELFAKFCLAGPYSRNGCRNLDSRQALKSG